MDDTGQLAALRTQIDTIDRQLVALLNERARIALQIGIAKGGQNIRRPEREAEVLRNVQSANSGPLADAAISKFFEEVIAVCRTIQYNK